MVNQDEEKVIDRDAPEPEESAEAFIKKVLEDIQASKTHHGPAFKRMERNREYARYGSSKAWKDLGRYRANLTNRHIQTRVSALYAKNPTVVAERRRRLEYKLWDGSRASFEQAIGVIASSQQMMADAAAGGAAAGMPATKVAPEELSKAQALLADIQAGRDTAKMIDRIGKTLEILYTYYTDNQNPKFKRQLKKLVRRVETDAVGFLKLGFQRKMEMRPEILKKIQDDTERLAHLKMLSANLADGETDLYSAEAGELEAGLTSLQEAGQAVTYEGLVFDFPSATSIIIDKNCTSIAGFIGAGFVAEEFMFTPDEIQELFGVDIKAEGSNYKSYAPVPGSGSNPPVVTVNSQGKSGQTLACVYIVYHKATRTQFAICDGYSDYLKAPAQPDIDIEQFYPLFPLIFNEVENDGDIYPPSDVELMLDMQDEHNRSREALRIHRRANKPKYITPANFLSKEDKDQLKDHKSSGVLELTGWTPGTDIKALLAPFQPAPIDPQVYTTDHIFDDILKVVGDQQANMGGLSGATATESSIAEGTRTSSLSSNTDDLDDFLSEVAEAGGQVLLKEVSAETVANLVGPGAVWPDMSREEISEMVRLRIRAGSSGRPNKAAAIANLERMMPYIIQIPGVNPELITRMVMKYLDEDQDVEDMLTEGLPSIAAMNSMAGKQVQPGDGTESDPNTQGQSGRPQRGQGDSRRPGGAQGPQM